MISHKTLLTAAALILGANGASAATYVYDFKAAAEHPGGAVGEAAFLSFDTTTIWAGPGLTVTADATIGGGAAQDDDPVQYVYFDDNNAGIGVCRDVINPSLVGVIGPTGRNNCDPGSDDGMTSPEESLTFTAQTDMFIGSIWVNSNHDSPDINDSTWLINGVIYNLATYTEAPDGDVEIILDFLLTANSSFTVQGTVGPDSYVSALSVSTVPLPAGAILLLSGLGALSIARRRRKS